LLQSLRNTETKKASVPRSDETGRERAMNTGTKLDFFKYLVARSVAFVALTTISTVVMALPYISSN
jgi:hypothetical protein